MAGNAINLSLLSRGIGEVKKNGSEKVEIKLEPEDYFNLKSDTLYLPPLSTSRSLTLNRNSIASITTPRHRSPRTRSASSIITDQQEVHLPKTFTTRKGALLLFSEDFLAKSAREDGETTRRGPHHGNLSRSADDLSLRTLSDLANSILTYGAKAENGEINLRFVRDRRTTPKRMRPGFSARRYLSRLTRTFDESFLENLLNKGYVQEKTLFQSNSLMPHLRRRINDDLSSLPPPYRILKNMLMAPGILSGYNFFRGASIAGSDLSMVLEEEEEENRPRNAVKRDSSSIVVVDLREGAPRSVVYSELEKREKENVLTDLLVKSAINHALEKQKKKMMEQMDDTLSIGGVQSVTSQDTDGKNRHRPVVIPSPRKSAKQHHFDMAEAVRSYLESAVDSSTVVGGGERAQSSRSTLKGSKLSSHSGKSFEENTLSPSPIWWENEDLSEIQDENSAHTRNVPASSTEREYVGDIPVVSFKEAAGGSATSSRRSSVTDMRVVAQPNQNLPTITDVDDYLSRGATQEQIMNKHSVLPPISHTMDLGDNNRHPDDSVLSEYEMVLVQRPVVDVNVSPPTPARSFHIKVPTSNPSVHQGFSDEEEADQEVNEKQTSEQEMNITSPSHTTAASSPVKQSEPASPPLSDSKDTVASSDLPMVADEPTRALRTSQPSVRLSPHQSPTHSQRTSPEQQQEREASVPPSHTNTPSKDLQSSMEVEQDGNKEKQDSTTSQNVTPLGQQSRGSSAADKNVFPPSWEVAPQPQVGLNRAGDASVGDSEASGNEDTRTSDDSSGKTRKRKLKKQLSQQSFVSTISLDSGGLSLGAGLSPFGSTENLTDSDPLQNSGRGVGIKGGALHVKKARKKQQQQSTPNSANKDSHTGSEMGAAVVEDADQNVQEDEGIERQTVNQQDDFVKFEDNQAGEEGQYQPKDQTDEDIKEGESDLKIDEAQYETDKGWEGSPNEEHLPKIHPETDENVSISRVSSESDDPGDEESEGDYANYVESESNNKNVHQGSTILAPGGSVIQVGGHINTGPDPVDELASVNQPSPLPEKSVGLYRHRDANEPMYTDDTLSASDYESDSSETEDGLETETDGFFTQESAQVSSRENTTAPTTSMFTTVNGQLALPPALKKPGRRGKKLTIPNVISTAESSRSVSFVDLQETIEKEAVVDEAVQQEKAERTERKREVKRRTRRAREKQRRAQDVPQRLDTGLQQQPVYEETNGVNVVGNNTQDSTPDVEGRPERAPVQQQQLDLPHTPETNLRRANSDLTNDISENALRMEQEVVKELVVLPPVRLAEWTQPEIGVVDNTPREFINEQSTDQDASPVNMDDETMKEIVPADSSSGITDTTQQTELVQALTEHAHKIAQSVLAGDAAGANLLQDAQAAANLWKVPGQTLSRSQSVQDNHAVPGMAGEEFQKRLSRSAAPTIAKYRDMLRAALVNVMLQQNGNMDSVPADVEISPDLIDVLVQQQLGPGDIEITKDDEGKSVIRVKSPGSRKSKDSPSGGSSSHRGSAISRALGGVKEGHIYQEPPKKDPITSRESSSPPQQAPPPSIQSNRVVETEDLGMEIINYGEVEKPAPAEGKQESPTEIEEVATVEIPSQPQEDKEESIQQEQEPSKPEEDQSSPKPISPKVQTQDSSEQEESKLVEEEKLTPMVSQDEEEKPLSSPLKKRESPPVEKNVTVKEEVKDAVQEEQKTNEVEEEEKEKVEEEVKEEEETKEEEEEDSDEGPVLYFSYTDTDIDEQPSSSDMEVTFIAEAAEPANEPIMEEQEEEVRPDTTKSSKSRRSLKSGKSHTSDKKSKTSVDDRDEFVVGKVDNTVELQKLYAPVDPPPPAKDLPKKPRVPPAPKAKPPPKKEPKKLDVGKKGGKAKKGKKGKKKELTKEPESAKEEEKPEEIVTAVEEIAPIEDPIEKPVEPAPESEPEIVTPSPEPEPEEEEMEFIIINDVSSESEPEPEPEPLPQIVEPEPESIDDSTESIHQSEADTETDWEEDEEKIRLKQVTARDARAAKRAAQAARRKEEVEKKRKEREEQVKKEKEEQERKEKIQLELEEERKRREESKRLERLRKEDEARREEQEEAEKLRKQQQEAEREKRMKEEYQKRVEEMKRRALEEEKRRKELEELKKQEEEERRKVEEELMAQMEEQERLDYQRKKLEEEERRKREEEEERIRRQEELKRQMEEAKRLAEEMARQQAELERRLQFNRSLQLESHGLGHTQDITRAFVYSYFELLQWLGLEVPDFMTLKDNMPY